MKGFITIFKRHTGRGRRHIATHYGGNIALCGRKALATTINVPIGNMGFGYCLQCKTRFNRGELNLDCMRNKHL